MTLLSKTVYIDGLDNIVNKYSSTYHSTIKMKPVNVKDNTCIDSDEKSNGNDSKFKVADQVRISKYKNIFAKVYTSNWSEEVFVSKKVKNTVSQADVINDFNGEEIVGMFYEKEIQ